MLSYCHSSQAARDMTLTGGLTDQLCFAHISKTNGGQDKRKVDSCIGKQVGPLERGQIKCGDVEVENPISTSWKIRIKVASVQCENCRCIDATPEDFRVFVTDCAKMSVNNSETGGYAEVASQPPAVKTLIIRTEA